VRKSAKVDLRWLARPEVAVRAPQDDGAIEVLASTQLKSALEIRLLRVRDLGILVGIIFTPVFGTDQFGP
jgi:hypothetical protein